MKLCIGCGERFDTPGWECPFCKATPTRIAGFLAFAPELAEASDGFDPSFFQELAPLEENNFWFRARNELIIWALRKYFPAIDNMLEVGCGTGFVLSGIEQSFPDVELCGCEIYSEGIRYAAERTGDCTLFQMDARRMPFAEEFDVIGAFDVLEHIDEDELVLSQMYQAIRNNGGIILTVPQHAFLWSQADEHARHARRYNAKDLIRKVQAAGFTVLRRTSFVSLLLPLMMISRWRQRVPVDEYDPLADLRLGGHINTVLKKILDLERGLIRAGVSLPLGGSLLIVARKGK